MTSGSMADLHLSPPPRPDPTRSSGLTARLVDPGAAEWEAVLGEARHDFYHLPGYVSASAPNDGGLPRALIVSDGHRTLLLPLVIRPIDGVARDACSPYGYPGPIHTGDPDAGFEQDALLAGVDHLRELGMVSLFIRTHPLLNARPPVGVGTVVQHGVTVSVDLTQSEDELWRQTRRNHRQQIRQALEKGYMARVAVDGRYMDEFKVLYRATMADRAADPYYFFDDDYFAALQAALGRDLHIAVAMNDGVAAAAGMFMVTDDIMQLHLTGHDGRFAADQPMKLVFHAVRSWGREQGLRVLHLGGGRGGAEDSLLHFKAGFSPWRQPYHTLRVVIDEPAYAHLVAAKDPQLDPSDLSRSFPAYRDARDR
jgi:hypothetical protein